MIGRVVPIGLELMYPSGRTTVLILVIRFQAPLEPITRFANQADETKPTLHAELRGNVLTKYLSPELTSRLAL